MHATHTAGNQGDPATRTFHEGFRWATKQPQILRICRLDPSKCCGEMKYSTSDVCKYDTYSLWGMSSSGSAATTPSASTVIIRKTNAIIPVNKRRPLNIEGRFFGGSIIVPIFFFFSSLLHSYDGYSICSLL